MTGEKQLATVRVLHFFFKKRWLKIAQGKIDNYAGFKFGNSNP